MRGAMIFAAGFGTRMAPLTDHKPKPMIDVGGKPLLDHTIEHAQRAQADPIVVNTHYLAPQIEAHLSGSAIKTIHEPQLLDTGGGLKAAHTLLGNAPCFTMNSDAIWKGPNPFSTLEQAWNDTFGALLLLAPLHKVTGRAAPGDFAMDADGRLTRGRDWVYLGAQIIYPAYASRVSDRVFSLNRVWDDLINDGLLFGAIYHGAWCDVGRPENIAHAEALLNRDDV